MKNAAPASTRTAAAPLIRGVARSAGGFMRKTENPPLAFGSRPPYQGVGKGAASCARLQQAGRPNEQEQHEKNQRDALRIAGRERRVANGELFGEREQQSADERPGDTADAANDERRKTLDRERHAHQVVRRDVRR